MRKDVVFEKYMRIFYENPKNLGFMKKYNLNENYGKGSTEQFFIEKGIELYRNKFSSNKNMKIENINRIRDVIEIGCCTKGKVIIKAYNKNELKEIYIMREGEAFFYNFDNNYDSFLMEYEDCTFYTIMLDITTISNLVLNDRSKFSRYLYEKINRVSNKNYFLSWEINNSKIKSSIEYIKKFNPKNILDFLEFKIEVIKYMLSLIEDLEEFSSEDKIIKECRKIILENVSKNISIKKIAEELNTSNYLLQKKIKMNYGITLYQYIKNLKMEYAEDLLKYTDMKIIEIASEVGYENPSKFSQVFSKIYGITPLKYRKQVYQKNSSE